MSYEQADIEDAITYKVVVNHEEQYSIWPVDRDNPPGWRDGGRSGPKSDCLSYINEVWTDMRPLSLRKQMEEAARHPVIDVTPEFDDAIEDSLVTRLSTGRHPVVISLRPEATLAALRERLELGYVHIKFTGTRGGTELGVPVDGRLLQDPAVTCGAGIVRLSGALTLDGVRVHCVADIDVATLSGQGHLEVVPTDDAITIGDPPRSAVH